MEKEELKINTNTEQTENSQGQEKSIVEHLCEKKEEKISEIEEFDFRDIGYSEEDVEQNENFKSTFEKYIKESGDDSKELLNLLEQKGIKIVKNSRFLSSRLSNEQFLGRFMNVNQSGTHASFATQEMIQDYLSKKLNQPVRQEMEECLNSPGAIFLGKNPNPKSIFHEGSHAIQHLSGMDMNAKDEETKIRREIETNIALIHLKNSGNLKDVSRGEYRVGKGPFGETAALNTNDIYQEVNYFTENVEKLQKIALQKEKDNVTKLENIRKKIGEM